MKSPRDKYHNDPQYRALVDHMVFMIQACQFTPSEMREAAVLASIRHEELNPLINWRVNMELEKALDVIAKFKSGDDYQACGECGYSKAIHEAGNVSLKHKWRPM